MELLLRVDPCVFQPRPHQLFVIPSEVEEPMPLCGKLKNGYIVGELTGSGFLSLLSDHYKVPKFLEMSRLRST